jgi:2-polyprenyl-3-methyl-5-hydroxy-6-metoxy-1,4-benzoquinol methylase
MSMAQKMSVQDDLRYFDAQCLDNMRWAERLGIIPERVFAPGVRVLDFGSGHGALTVMAAAHGAQVVGIDLNARRVAFATRYVSACCPALAPRIEFSCMPVETLQGEAQFDLIVSKDTFEHASGLDSILRAFVRLLAPGGRIFLGFSPLWYSPFGDHGFLTRRRLPWAHLLLGDARFLRAHNAHTGRFDRTVAEAGFNQLKPRDFRDAFARNGLRIDHMRINPARAWKRAAFFPLDLARHHPKLEAFATIGIYARLRHAS